MSRYHSNLLKAYLTISDLQLYLLASFRVLHAEIITVEELSIKQLDGNDGKDEVK